MICNECTKSYAVESSPSLFLCGLCYRRLKRSKTNPQYSNRTYKKRAREIKQSGAPCVLCGTTKDITAHHVIPLAKGGDINGPLAPLCRSCNSNVGAKIIDIPAALQWFHD